MTHEEIARENAACGFNCCQSVFTSFCEELGLEREKALLLASGFGSGVSIGEVCGAVTGAVMAIGLKEGFTEASPEAKAAIREQVQAFIDGFKEKYGSIYCRELIGYNITASEQARQRALDEQVFLKVCRDMIGGSAQMLEEFFSTGSSGDLADRPAENARGETEEER